MNCIRDNRKERKWKDNFRVVLRRVRPLTISPPVRVTFQPQPTLSVMEVEISTLEEAFPSSLNGLDNGYK